MSEREKLEKQAQEKLSQAWTLIREAGELAKQGQFYLSFGEVGEFIPSSLFDRKRLREEALTILKAEGKDNGGSWVPSPTEKYSSGAPIDDWVPNPATPFELLSEVEVELELESIIDQIINDSGISYEAREYGEHDQWWHPSRC